MHYQSPTGSVQSISFTAPTSTQAGQTVALSATANSGLVVTFSSQTPAICSVSGTQVTTLAAGTCTIAADQAGDTTHWTAAPTVTQSFTVTGSGGGGGGIAQTINFPVIPAQSLNSPIFTISPTASSGLSVTVISQSPSICSISNYTVTLLANGLCTLVASQAGNATYAPAPTVTQSFSVSGSSSGGGGSGNDADVPIPGWALALLGLLLMDTMRRAQRKSAH